MKSLTVIMQTLGDIFFFFFPPKLGSGTEICGDCSFKIWSKESCKCSLQATWSCDNSQGFYFMVLGPARCYTRNLSALQEGQQTLAQ